jgi:hypothetical protein
VIGADDTMATMTTTRKLTKQDRCDRCSAAAQHIVTLPSGFELTFCGHHYRANEESLKSQGAVVDNEVAPA